MSTIQPPAPVFQHSELEKFFGSVASETNAIALSDDACSEQVKLLSRSQLAAAFTELHARLAQHRQERAAQLRVTAEHFNVFDYIAPDENLLSDVLRLLLDPEGSHGQGDAFLYALIRRVNPIFSGDCHDASVVREAVTYSIKHCRRRIDVLAAVPSFVLAIETKKFAGEGREQIHDYCEHLTNIAGENFCLIFLTRTGAEASSIAPEVGTVLLRKGRLKCWSWERDIRDWLTECASKCEAPKMRHFIKDFQTYIGTFLAIQLNPEQNHESQ